MVTVNHVFYLAQIPSPVIKATFFLMEGYYCACYAFACVFSVFGFLFNLDQYIHCFCDIGGYVVIAPILPSRLDSAKLLSLRIRISLLDWHRHVHFHCYFQFEIVFEGKITHTFVLHSYFSLLFVVLDGWNHPDIESSSSTPAPHTLKIYNRKKYLGQHKKFKNIESIVLLWEKLKNKRWKTIWK